MNTSLSHLPQQKQDFINGIVQIIVEKVSPEKVILFGSHATGKWINDLTVEEGRLFEYRSDYDMLVITKEEEKRYNHELREFITRRIGTQDTVEILIHDIEYINGQLSEGQYFFAEIQQQGILLYDTGNTTLSEKRVLSGAEKKALAQGDLDFWISDAREFLIDANNAFARGSLKTAAFYLHQSAERTYNAVILVFRGYKQKTHNLERLYRATKHYSATLAGVFPQDTQEEKNVFTQLKKGYVEARYDKKYIITKEEVGILIDRVTRLQKIAEEVCREKIASFDQPGA